MPAQAVLLAHTHPGVNRKQQMGKELRKACPDGRAQSRLSCGERNRTRPRLRACPDSGGGVAIDPFVVDAILKISEKGSLPAIAAEVLLRATMVDDFQSLATRLTRPRGSFSLSCAPTYNQAARHFEDESLQHR